MLAFLAEFTKDENGAVTVDWVVLTAAIVGLGIAVIATVSNGALDYSSGIGAYLSSQDVSTY
jgi:Flp pilus assembly pilin Flp